MRRVAPRVRAVNRALAARVPRLAVGTGRWPPGHTARWYTSPMPIYEFICNALRHAVRGAHPQRRPGPSAPPAGPATCAACCRSFAVHSSSPDLGGQGRARTAPPAPARPVPPATDDTVRRSRRPPPRGRGVHALRAARDAHAGRVRRGRPRRRAHVRRRGARLPRGPAGTPVRRRRRQAARGAARDHRADARSRSSSPTSSSRGRPTTATRGPRRSRPASPTCGGRSSSSGRRSICTLGNFATKLLSGDQTGITRVHGKPRRIEIGGVEPLPVPDLPSGRRAVHAGDAGDAQGRHRYACPSCSRMPRGAEPAATPAARASLPLTPDERDGARCRAGPRRADGIRCRAAHDAQQAAPWRRPATPAAACRPKQPEAAERSSSASSERPTRGSMLSLTLRSPAATRRFARVLAGVLEPPALVTIEGDLGTGKTTLVREVLRAPGVRGAVTSPSFTLAQSYRGRDGVTLHHLDLYRLSRGADVDLFAWEDYLGRDAITFVEWPAAGQRGAAAGRRAPRAAAPHPSQQDRRARGGARPRGGRRRGGVEGWSGAATAGLGSAARTSLDRATRRESARSLVILALETATTACSAACAPPTARSSPSASISRARRTRSGCCRSCTRCSRRPASTLGDIDTIVCGLGPGAYTGMRIGVATARALAQARALRLGGVPTSRRSPSRSPTDARRRGRAARRAPRRQAPRGLRRRATALSAATAAAPRLAPLAVVAADDLAGYLGSVARRGRRRRRRRCSTRTCYRRACR